jgi:hypothetical protein
MSISANGNIGIGDSTPAVKLVVNGSINTTSINAASHTVGTSTIANATGVYTSVVNAASHTVGTSTIANATGVYTSVVNAASHTVGTSTIANATGVYTSVVNAASHTVGTAFTANATVVNAVSYNSGSTLIANSTGPYGKTEGNLNVNSAATLATSRNINGSAFNGSANITTASWGTGRTFTIGATSRTVDGSGNASWSLAEIDAPSRTGSGASGTWGINITGNAGTANGLETTQSSLGYSASAQNIEFNGQGGPQVRGQGGGAAMMSFHRPGAHAINFGLGTDNQLRNGGWSRGGNFVILDSGNYNSYAPTLTGGNASGNWNIRSTNYTDYGGVDQDLRTSASPSFSAGTFAGLHAINSLGGAFRTGAGNYGIRIYAGGGSDSTASVIQFTNSAQDVQIASIAATSSAFILGSDNNTTVYIKANGSNKYQFDTSGNFVANSNITAYGATSDERLKENIAPISNTLEMVKRLQGVTFNWKEGTSERDFAGINNDIGLIAQNVQEVIPELVREGQDGYLSLRDRGLFAILIEAIKEQQIQIEELKKKIG